MRNVTVAAVQMKCSKSVEKNIAHAEELVRQAAAKGAEIVLLPELFERPYFCQERRYEYYEYAQTAEENPAVRHFSRVAAELGIVIPVSFYEKEVNNTYNSVDKIRRKMSSINFQVLVLQPQQPSLAAGRLWASGSRVTLTMYWLMTSSSQAQNGRVKHCSDMGHSLVALPRQVMGATLPSMARRISPAV